MEYLSSTDPDYSIWLSFRRTHEAIHKIRKIELRPYKLSTVETAVLVTVYRANNKVTPAEISRQLLKDAHSISQLLVRMEKRGLLKRVKGVPRKNMIKVVLTRKGQEAYYHGEKGKAINKIMSALSEKEKKQLVVCLDKLREKAMEVLH